MDDTFTEAELRDAYVHHAKATMATILETRELPGDTREYGFVVRPEDTGELLLAFCGLFGLTLDAIYDLRERLLQSNLISDESRTYLDNWALATQGIMLLALGHRVLPVACAQKNGVTLCAIDGPASGAPPRSDTH
ncbi:MAG: hypothetical protein P1P84_02510 [Deferrisomatales bacterium]|nr:hypothetical protein [Deferrisomatales bacterium]